VTLKIMNGDTVLYAERITMSVEAFSKDSKGVAREVLTVSVPAFRDYCKNGEVLTVTASYELDGETVYSQRKWTVKGGETTDEQPPVYDWLVEEDETQPDETQPVETQPVETQPDETQPDETQPVETQPTETQPADTRPDESRPVGGAEGTDEATAPTDDGTDPAHTEGQGSGSGSDTQAGTDKKGCASTVSAAALLLTAGCALALSKKREKFIDQ
jgi:hypothetical protein